jgi:hypothetical protein
MRSSNLQNMDGKKYLAGVKFPTLVTGAAASLYFNPATRTDKIYDCSTSLKDGVEVHRGQHSIRRLPG